MKTSLTSKYANHWLSLSLVRRRVHHRRRLHDGEGHDLGDLDDRAITKVTGQSVNGVTSVELKGTPGGTTDETEPGPPCSCGCLRQSPLPIRFAESGTSSNRAKATGTITFT